MTGGGRHRTPRHVKRGLVGVDDHRLFCDVVENNIMKIYLMYLICFVEELIHFVVSTLF